MFCLTVSLLLALLFTGCASTVIKTSTDTERYLADASFTADKNDPVTIMSDISFRPIEEYQECCRRDNNRDHMMNLMPDRFVLAQEKTEDKDFNEFEKEFGDVTLDTQAKGVSDPLSGYNRFMFNVNDKLYFWILKPVAQGYGAVIPEGGRVAINRFFKNLSLSLIHI